MSKILNISKFNFVFGPDFELLGPNKRVDLIFQESGRTDSRVKKVPIHRRCCVLIVEYYFLSQGKPYPVGWCHPMASSNKLDFAHTNYVDRCFLGTRQFKECIAPMYYSDTFSSLYTTVLLYVSK